MRLIPIHSVALIWLFGLRAPAAGAILNGANEAAVAQFLDGKIGFLDIAEKVEQAMEKVPVIQNPSLLDVLQADAAAREAAL